MNVSNERLRELAEYYESFPKHDRLEAAGGKTRGWEIAFALRAVLAVRELCEEVERHQTSDMDEPLGARRKMLEGIRAIVGAAEDER